MKISPAMGRLLAAICCKNCHGNLKTDDHIWAVAAAPDKQSKNTLSDFPIHIAAQFRGDGAQFRLKAVARAAAWQPKDEFDPLLLDRPVLGDDAAAMRLQYLAIGPG